MLHPWMIIGGITFLVALGTPLVRPQDLTWGQHLERPRWLVFEPAIPLIWTVIFACGAWSAVLVWRADPGSGATWALMALYLLLEGLTVAYIPATLRTRSLWVGTLLGGSGVVVGLLLALRVWQIDPLATLLLLPYILWSPIGTYTTRRMIDLNPDSA